MAASGKENYGQYHGLADPTLPGGDEEGRTFGQQDPLRDRHRGSDQDALALEVGRYVAKPLVAKEMHGLDDRVASTVLWLRQQIAQPRFDLEDHLRSRSRPSGASK